jgi:predicted N-acetyltransferase YhbS
MTWHSGRRMKALMVEKLRQNDLFIPQLSLVAEADGDIAGHILFYPVYIFSTRSRYQCLSLAPMSVVPGYQRRGIGSQLVRTGLKAAGELGFESVIVLGHPEYYPRFGFKPASRWHIKVPFEVPDEAFMALELTDNALANISGAVRYPEEFAEV